MKRLVLLGGGHTHALALQASTGTDVQENLMITLVSESRFTVYGGLAPEILAGEKSFENSSVDLEELASRASAAFVCASVIGIDVINQNVELSTGGRLPYDLLSINMGSRPDLSLLSGAEINGYSLRPFGTFNDEFEKFLEATAKHENELNLVQIGAGAAGCEMAVAMATRIKRDFPQRDLKLTLIETASSLLPEAPAAAGRQFEAVLKSFRTRIMLESRVKEVRSEAVALDNGIAVRSDFTAIATAPRPEQWVQDLPLVHSERGFLEINKHLLTSDPKIFAVGGVAQFSGRKISRAGAYALAEAPTLAANWLRAARGQKLKCYRPRTHALALLGDGRGGIVAYIGRLVFPRFLPITLALKVLKIWRERQFLRLF